MKVHAAWALAIGILCACSARDKAQENAATSVAPPAGNTASAAPALGFGVDRTNMDPSTRPQDDFYRYVNGKWLDTTAIPVDESEWDAFSALADETAARLRAIIEKAATNDASATDADQRKIGDLYASFLDEQTIDVAALTPLDATFARIEAARNKTDIAVLMAELERSLSRSEVGSTAGTLPFNMVVHQDHRDATKYIVDLQQSGLALPDRDYYIEDDDAKLKDIRTQYQIFLGKIFALTGDTHAADSARDVLALETKLARAQWTNVDLRDPVKGYNRTEIVKLPSLAPGFDWNAYLDAAGIKGKVDTVNLGQPSYIAAFARLMQDTPVSTWKTYLRWKVLHDMSPFLSKDFVDVHFAFFGTILDGTPQQQPRWRRGIYVVNYIMGEALGRLYIASYFSAQSKQRADLLVGNFLAAFRNGIDALAWMGPDTKREAQAKLTKIIPKIGYPDRWRDYAALEIVKGDLFGNVKRAYAFEYQRNIDKLGKPVDRGEWSMNAQTVNAYYNPELNEIVFPAGILQPPFFNPEADDAVNYGAIGAVIGHEISHAFDDEGAQYDGDGNLRDWWTKEDHAKFAAKTRALAGEYDRFEPLPGYHINGQLTLGENIADNSGLALAYKAYQISLGGKTAPVIDGFTGDQRFFLGFAQIWRSKLRDNYLIELIKSDTHSIKVDRALGTLANQPEFYSAFDVKPGDKMFVAPEQRITIW